MNKSGKSMFSRLRVVRSFVVATALLSELSSYGQTVSGQISGTLIDQQGASVAGAAVTLTSDLVQQVRELKTDANGSFIFTNLVPGNYSLRIVQSGFQTYNQKAINVSTQERVDLHTIPLKVGDVNVSVDVAADTAHVATDSSDRSISLNTTQIQDIPSIGRQFTDVMRSLPGVQLTSTTDLRGWGVSTPAINGGQSGQVLVTLDGVGSQDGGTFGLTGFVSPSIDAIGEVKVLVSNYNAEYGARAGGQVNFSVKSGTSSFHGSLYDYYRHESLNANEFFNNKNGLGKPRYRYQNPGGTIGGPVLIPGTNFNRSRTRLFFFYSDDYLHNQSVSAVSQYSMPSALERAGDFSQTVTTRGVLIPIKDPITGQPFAGNIVPVSRISPIGSAMLNLFPLPSTTDSSGQRQFNALYQNVVDYPREDRILRLDFAIGPKTTSFVRLEQDRFGRNGYGTPACAAGSSWHQFKCGYSLPSAGMVATIIHTFRPNLINEFTAGVNASHQHIFPDDPAYANSQLPLKGPNGQPLTLPNFFDSNSFNVLPNINFGTTGAQSAGQAVTNAPSFGTDVRWPFEATEHLYNLTDNLTWVKGSHTLKAGIYTEFDARGTVNYATYNPAGTYWFGSDTANPNDTGYAYSNLLTGAIQAYGEDNQRLVAHGHYHHVEWFVQDTWKINRRLTIDAGMRFQIISPFVNVGATLNVFDQGTYNRNQVGQLLYPALASGKAVAINPLTGATYAYPRQGSFDPASYSANQSPYSGMKSYNTAFFNTPPVLYGPRFGFALDVLGDGKMALRGGFGIFYDNALTVDTIANLATTPPTFQAPLFFNTTFNTLLNTQGFLSPQTVNGGSQNYKNPTTYNWSMGIQRDLGKGFILDAAYVGNVRHHGMGINANGPPTVDLNAIAPYTTWSPASGVNGRYQDPTNSTGGLYTTNLLRALAGGYSGYSAINVFTSSGESYYDAMQLQVNRRFGRRFQMSSNYTWSKTIVYSRLLWVSDSLNKNVVNRPHAVNLNFGFHVPNGSSLWSNHGTRLALDGWNLDGVGAYFAGTPLTIGCSAQNVPANLGNYWTGTPTGGVPFRCQMTGNLWLAPGATPASANSTADPRLWYPFNPASFVLPPAKSLGIGNTPPTLTYGPGFENWDLSLYKEFRLGKDNTRVLQFRVEAFNVFNHFNPGNPNTSLSYNFTTGAQTNANFGTITSAQNSARHTSLSLRYRF
jgi:hypothetical protein